MGKWAVMPKFAEMTSSSNFFHVAFFPLSGLLTGPGLLDLELYFFKGLTRNLEIGSIPI